MQLLFKESHGENEDKIDFEWQQTGATKFDEIDVDEIINYAKGYNYERQTFIYFYTELVLGDAVNDKVRTMIAVRFKDGKFDVNFNTSDYILAMNMDKIKRINEKIVSELN